ncbi:sensor histidine kinase [Olleya sp. HaHaR_3_96]|uniref:sensor histidine kinase n=1 Tax=Olleya sp. HaHaR_3_96 TaxID=2745560 RepID=UPI001C4F2113|nr:sensor histidine kinase [Olleya sp. HaHaR_3_96]QXP58776.1 histidine kinase [Olleya sp. HaHaR_3_96]
MNIKKEWIYHGSLALLILALQLLQVFVLKEKQGFFKLQSMLLEATFYSTCIIIYFINFKIVCPYYLKRIKIAQFLIALVVLLLSFAGIRYLLEEVILFNIAGFHNYYEATRRVTFYILDNSYYAIKPILYSTLVYLAIKIMETNNHNKAELDHLKSQISPHFLFNTLNAFYVELIDDKPETAKDIHKLSELLRYVTYDSQKDFVFLSNDIKFLEDYIHFFKKRFENEFSVDFQVSGVVHNQQIPALVLIHFIENLFKHGVVNDKNNPATINLVIDEAFIILRTRNKILTSEKFMASGIGTKNVKRRLSTLFNSNYELVYTDDTPYFNTHLKMPVWKK